MLYDTQNPTKKASIPYGYVSAYIITDPAITDHNDNSQSDCIHNIHNSVMSVTSAMSELYDNERKTASSGNVTNSPIPA